MHMMKARLVWQQGAGRTGRQGSPRAAWEARLPAPEPEHCTHTHSAPPLGP